MQRIARSEGGFTLIEVMLAIVLLTIGLLTLAEVFPQGLFLVLYGKEQTKAAAFAQQQIDNLRDKAASQGASTIQADVGAFNTCISTETITDVADGETFSRDTQVAFWTYPGGPGAPPYTPVTPPGTCSSATVPTLPYVLNVTVAVHWNPRGKLSTFSPTTGCGATASATASAKFGCVQLSTFIHL